MSTISSTSNAVLRSFIAGANAQYRDAGLGQHQMRVARDGTVSFPNRPSPKFKSPPASGDAAATQASDGASPSTANQGAQPAPAPIKRAGAAPAVKSAATADGFQLAWPAVPGAKTYGIWQDGVLLGHVTKPSFTGTLAAGARGVVQVDAVRADGSRTDLAAPLRIMRGSDGAVAISEPAASTTAAPASTAPTAPATQAG